MLNFDTFNTKMYDIRQSIGPSVDISNIINVLSDSTTDLNEYFNVDVSLIGNITTTFKYNYSPPQFTCNYNTLSYLFKIDDPTSDITIPLKDVHFDDIEIIQGSFSNCYNYFNDVLINNAEKWGNDFPTNARFTVDNSLVFNLTADVLGTSTALWSQFHTQLNDQNTVDYVGQKRDHPFAHILHQYRQPLMHGNAANESLNNLNDSIATMDSTIYDRPCDVSQNVLAFEHNKIGDNAIMVLDGSFTKFNHSYLNYYNNNVDVELIHEEVPVLTMLSAQKIGYYDNDEYNIQEIDISSIDLRYGSESNSYSSNLLRYYSTDIGYELYEHNQQNTLFGNFNVGLNLADGNEIAPSPHSQQEADKNEDYINGTLIQFSTFFEETVSGFPSVDPNPIEPIIDPINPSGEGEGEGEVVKVNIEPIIVPIPIPKDINTVDEYLTFAHTHSLVGDGNIISSIGNDFFYSKEYNIGNISPENTFNDSEIIRIKLFDSSDDVNNSAQKLCLYIDNQSYALNANAIKYIQFGEIELDRSYEFKSVSDLENTSSVTFDVREDDVVTISSPNAEMIIHYKNVNYILPIGKNNSFHTVIFDDVTIDPYASSNIIGQSDEPYDIGESVFYSYPNSSCDNLQVRNYKLHSIVKVEGELNEPSQLIFTFDRNGYDMDYNNIFEKIIINNVTFRIEDAYTFINPRGGTTFIISWADTTFIDNINKNTSYSIIIQTIYGTNTWDRYLSTEHEITFDNYSGNAIFKTNNSLFLPYESRGTLSPSNILTGIEEIVGITNFPNVAGGHYLEIYVDKKTNDPAQTNQETIAGIRLDDGINKFEYYTQDLGTTGSFGNVSDSIYKQKIEMYEHIAPSMTYDMAVLQYNPNYIPQDGLNTSGDGFNVYRNVSFEKDGDIYKWTKESTIAEVDPIELHIDTYYPNHTIHQVAQDSLNDIIILEIDTDTTTPAFKLSQLTTLSLNGKLYIYNDFTNVTTYIPNHYEDGASTTIMRIEIAVPAGEHYDFVTGVDYTMQMKLTNPREIR